MSSRDKRSPEEQKIVEKHPDQWHLGAFLVYGIFLENHLLKLIQTKEEIAELIEKAQKLTPPNHHSEATKLGWREIRGRLVEVLEKKLQELQR